MKPGSLLAGAGGVAVAPLMLDLRLLMLDLRLLMLDLRLLMLDLGLFVAVVDAVRFAGVSPRMRGVLIGIGTAVAVRGWFAGLPWHRRRHARPRGGGRVGVAARP